MRGEGEALIRVLAVPLNPIEINVGAGRFYGGHPPLPFVPGGEGVGRVVEAETLAPGTLVWAHGGGMGTRRDGTLGGAALGARGRARARCRTTSSPRSPERSGSRAWPGWLPVAYRAPVRGGRNGARARRHRDGRARGDAGRAASRRRPGRCGRTAARGAGAGAAAGADAVVSRSRRTIWSPRSRRPAAATGPSLVIDPRLGRAGGRRGDRGRARARAS